MGNLIGVKVYAEEAEKLVKVSVEGRAVDDNELIRKAIQILIQQMDLKTAFNDDKVTFDNEMKRIIHAIVENYVSNGFFDQFADKEEYYKEDNGVYILTENGFNVVATELFKTHLSVAAQ